MVSPEGPESEARKDKSGGVLGKGMFPSPPARELRGTL